MRVRLLPIVGASLLWLLLLLVLRHVLLLSRPVPFDRIERSTDLAQADLQVGLNVDALPLVQIDYGRFKPASDTPDEHVDHDQPDKSITREQTRQLCLTRGAYLGAEVTTNDAASNCAEHCGLDPSEVQYTFLTQADTRQVVAGRERLRAGGYCVPTAMANCNRSTSKVVYTITGWRCLSRTDAFAGAGGNRIVVCNGDLRDNATQTVYRRFIPPNLVFTDVYRDRLADGRFRFECPQAEVDAIGNPYLVSPLNRLHRLRNWCTETIPYAAGAESGDDGGVRVDFDAARCVCGPQLFETASGRCTACRNHFDDVAKQIAFTQKPCFSFEDTVEQFEQRLAQLKQQIGGDTDKLGDVALFPCGFNDQGAASERTLPRCLNYFAAVYQPALPSHNTLRTIDSYAATAN